MMYATSLVMETCLRAGEIMLKNGAETYRVEDTIGRIARACDVKTAHSYVTPTGIFISLTGPEYENEQTKIIRISNRAIDLNKVTLVNDVSRKLALGSLTLHDARHMLDDIDSKPLIYHPWVQHVAAGVASGCLAIVFGGTIKDFAPAFIAGLLANVTLMSLNSIVSETRFVAEFIATIIAALSSILFFSLSFGEHLDFMIIGSLMPLFPGVAVTNSVRDIMAGDLVAGVARGAEAMLTALAIATGVSIVLAIFV